MATKKKPYLFIWQTLNRIIKVFRIAKLYIDFLVKQQDDYIKIE